MSQQSEKQSCGDCENRSWRERDGKGLIKRVTVYKIHRRPPPPGRLWEGVLVVIFGCLRLSRQTMSALQLGLDQTGKDQCFTLSNSNTMLFPYSISLLCYSVAEIKGGHKRLLWNSGSCPELSAMPRPRVEKKHFPHVNKSYKGRLYPRNQTQVPPKSHKYCPVLKSPPTCCLAARQSVELMSNSVQLLLPVRLQSLILTRMKLTRVVENPTVTSELEKNNATEQHLTHR